MALSPMGVIAHLADGWLRYFAVAHGFYLVDRHSGIGGLLLGITAEPLLLPSFSAGKISSIFAGITLGAGLLSASVTLFAGVLQQWWQGLGVRILGSWITACTLLVLALHWLGHKLPVS